MGLQDRDYYVDAWDCRMKGDIHGYHTGRSLVKRVFKNGSNSLHPVLLFIFTVGICLGVFVLLKLILHFAK